MINNIQINEQEIEERITKKIEKEFKSKLQEFQERVKSENQKAKEIIEKLKNANRMTADKLKDAEVKLEQ